MELGVTNRAVNNTGQKKEGMVGRMEVSSRKRKRMVCPSPESPENLVKNSEVALQYTPPKVSRPFSRQSPECDGSCRPDAPVCLK